MPYSNYPTGFMNGVTIRGVPIDIPNSGEVFWVSNAAAAVTKQGVGGADGNPGTYQKPFATIASALTRCKAGRGDIIYVTPGYTQTVATAGALDLNVAGVSIIGLGSGSLRPTLTLSAAAATILMSAANMTLHNFILVGGFADVAVAFITSAANITISNCRFEQSGTDLNFLSCIQTSAVANESDGLHIIGCERYEIDAAALAMISVLEATNDLVIDGNHCSTGGTTNNVGHFLILAAKVVLNAKIINNTLSITSAATDYSVGLLITGSATSCTGVVAHNLVASLDATGELLDTATLDFQHFENYYTGTLAKSAYLLPAVA